MVGSDTDKKFLADTKPEEAFWFCNGSVAMNVYQFADTIEHSGEDVFLYHTANNHDFAQWIKDVLGDEVFFYQINKECDKNVFLNKLRARIAEVENRFDE